MTAIPVLAFHAIGNGAGPTWTSADAFARMIDAVLEAGFQPVVARSIAAMIRTGEVTGKPLAITFDDGYRSVHSVALPLLAARRMPATVFAVTGAPGRNDWDGAGSYGGGLELLSQDEIAALVEAGWEIGSHTHTHLRLRSVEHDVVEQELARSLAALAAMGIEAVTMAYPYGAHDETSADIVRTRMIGGFSIGAQVARATSDPAAIERIDAWYLRPPFVARHLDDTIGRVYLASRQAGRAVGQRVRGDRS